MSARWMFETHEPGTLYEAGQRLNMAWLRLIVVLIVPVRKALRPPARSTGETLDNPPTDPIG